MSVLWCMLPVPTDPPLPCPSLPSLNLPFSFLCLPIQIMLSFSKPQTQKFTLGTALTPPSPTQAWRCSHSSHPLVPRHIFCPISSGRIQVWRCTCSLVSRTHQDRPQAPFLLPTSPLSVSLLNHRTTESQNGRSWKGPLGVI